jgi:kynurenine formamidase
MKNHLAALALSIALGAGASRADVQGVPTPGPLGWGAGDELGNGNTQGYGTRLRCATQLLNPDARLYELSHVFSETMPQGLFGDAPVSFDYLPTAGIAFTRHAGNGEIFNGGLGSQGTQFDALGHFGVLDAPWFGGGPFPADQVRYYNGFTQSDVKPDPAGPLAKLGVDKAVPIVTSALLLDAQAYRGRPLEAGETITAADVQGMLSAQGLEKRGILPGDAVYIHTGWSALWQDPSPNPASTPYYSQGPGLAVDAQQYLAERTVVLIALDNPFTDPLKTCQLTGACPPTPGSLPFLPFSIHHLDLTNGIHQIQNLVLDEMASDRTWLSCTMVLPLRLKGAAGSAVRPIAIGAPRRR